MREPCSASSESAHARSAASASLRARTRPSARNDAMNCVPLISDSPSFASSTIGSRPTRASASKPGTRSPSTNASPSPTSGSARCASGARSPDAPTEPRLGTTGSTPRSRHSSSSSTVSIRAPEFPFASVFARSSIAERTISSGYGSPTPHACERSSRSCSSPRQLLGNRAVDEAAEAGVDAVRVLVRAVSRALDERAGGAHLVAGGVGERQRARGRSRPPRRRRRADRRR